jgi:hypothetical protein
LVSLVRDGNDVQKQKAAGALWGLSMNAENKVEIASCGGIRPLVALVRDGNDVQKENAAAALWNLSVNTENKVEIALCGGIPVLVALVRDGNDAQKENGAGALWNLAYQNQSGAADIVELGGTEPLLRLVFDGNQEQKVWAAGVLGFLNPDPEIKATVAANGGVAALLEFIRGSSDDDDRLEGMAALQSLVRGGGVEVRASVETADGFALLSEMMISSNDKIQVLARAILLDLLDGAREIS